MIVSETIPKNNDRSKSYNKETKQPQHSDERSRAKSDSNIDVVFGTASTKESVMELLRSGRHLGRIPLPSPSISVEQAAKDFKRERVLFNQVPFIPNQDDRSRSNGFVLSLQRLVERLQRQGSCVSPDVADVTGLILQRACRTTTGADSYFMVQKLFCVSGTHVTHKSGRRDPPVKVDVFVVEGQERGCDSRSHLDTDRQSYSGWRRDTRFTQNDYHSAVADGTASNSQSHFHRTPLNDTHTSTVVEVDAVSPVTGDRMTVARHDDDDAHRQTEDLDESCATSVSSSGRVAGFTSGEGDLGALTNITMIGTFATFEDMRESISSFGGDRNVEGGDACGSIYADLSALAPPSPRPALELCARIEAINMFLIMDTDAVDTMTDEQSEPAVWLELEATVTDELNFTSGEAWRSLRVRVVYPDLSTEILGGISGGCIPSSSSARSSRRLSMAAMTLSLSATAASPPINSMNGTKAQAGHAQINGVSNSNHVNGSSMSYSYRQAFAFSSLVTRAHARLRGSTSSTSSSGVNGLDRARVNSNGVGIGAGLRKIVSRERLHSLQISSDFNVDGELYEDQDTVSPMHPFTPSEAEHTNLSGPQSILSFSHIRQTTTITTQPQEQKTWTDSDIHSPNKTDAFGLNFTSDVSVEPLT